MMQKRIYILLSLVICLSVLLAACAPQEIIKTVVVTQVVEKQGNPVVVEKAVTVTPVPTAAKPTVPPTKSVDSVVIAMQQEPDTLHFLLGSTQAKTYIQSVILPGCMSQNEKAEWVALGCESVPTLDNGGAKLVGEGDDKHLEITYKIRKGWRWTDGTPVTTKDIVYWWKLSMDPEFEIAGRGQVEKIYDIVSVDDSTATVKYLSKKQLNQAIAGTLTGSVDFKAMQADYKATYGDNWASFAVDPTFWNNAIFWLPSHILSKIPAKDQAASEFARKPVGDGPYEIKEWKAGQDIVLVKSKLPFALGDAKLNTITFRFFGDAAGVLAALKKGEVDAATGNVGGLTESNGADLDALEALGRYKVAWVKGYNFEHIDLNTTKFPLDDVRVRQALAYAIDRNSINQTIFFGKKTITDLPLPKGLSWAYPQEGSIQSYTYNLDKAKQLLKDAGWDCSARPCTKKDKDGKTVKLEFTFITTDRESRVQAAQIIQQNWFRLNVGVSIQFLYGRGLFAVCSAGGPLYCRTFDAAMYTFSTLDDATFSGLYGCASIPAKENNYSGQNNPGWCNKKAEEAINNSENNPDVALSLEKRKPYLLQFFNEFTKEMPAIMLYGSAEPFPHLVGWKNFKPGPTSASLMTWNSWEWEVSK